MHEVALFMRRSKNFCMYKYRMVHVFEYIKGVREEVA